MSFSLLLETFALKPVAALDQITPQINALLTDPVQQYADFLKYNAETQEFNFNEGYKPGGNTLGTSAAPKFSGSFPLDGSKGLAITDPATSSTLIVKPLFNVGDGSRDSSRIVYPILGKDAIKVVSLGGIGYKEDIVVNTFQGDRLSFSYQLELPGGVEARLESDGSIGFYGVQNELLGNVTAATEADEKLVNVARKNGQKTNLLFKMPAPYVVEYGRQDTEVNTYFELEGNILKTVATNLRQANYPLTIDPSVYVESARNFMRGNNETNVDFDVTNELIQKGSTTGARFAQWSSTLALNEGRFNGGTTVAGGYMYQVGGVSGTATANTTTYSTAGSNTFSVPAGVTSVTIKAWGGGGGGGGGSTNGNGGTGGGGAYSTATFTVTPAESLNVVVGGGGSGGAFSTGGSGNNSGDGGGGGGHSEVNRSGTPLIIASGGGGGGGGDNSSATTGAAGAAGGDLADGLDGDPSLSAGGGAAATNIAAGLGGTGGNNSGSAGGSEFGGDGADGRDNQGSDGSKNNGGSNGGGDGGNGDQNANGYAGGGGGGSGYFGGGGGSGSLAGNAGGGGGGSGSSYITGSGSAQAGNGAAPGNTADSDRTGLSDGGIGGTGTGGSSTGTSGDSGIVLVTYYSGSSNVVESDVYWANIDDTNNQISSPNPGAGSCTNWCTNSAYNLPDERKGFSLVAYNGFMYAIGGLDSTNTRQSSVFIAKIGANGEPSLWHPTDTNKNNWLYWFQDTTLTEGVSYSAAAAYNNRLYLLGGTTDSSPGGTSTASYAEIQPTGTLSSFGVLTSMSTVRFQHTVEIYNDSMYVIGGDSSTSGSLLNSVEYVKLADDGTFNGSWESTNSFTGARRTNGGDFTTVYGAYIYIMGGCTVVSTGNCQTVGNDVQLASINADGSIGKWGSIDNVTNGRVGYGLHAWQNSLYRVGGCSIIVTSSDNCVVALDSVGYGVIYPEGEASTVSTSQNSGTAPCNGGDPDTCNLPSASVGNVLNASVILNGYLYIMGGCTNNPCTTYSAGVTYQAINSDGILERPATCPGGSYTDSYCVSPNSLPVALGAPGVTVFDGTIYVIGGFPTVDNIYYSTVGTDGSLGTWQNNNTNTGTTTVADRVSYTYAYTRASPSTAATNPGNLYIFGGCSQDGGGSIASVGCSGYSSAVYKCNITTSRTVTGCSTSGQLQIGAITGNNGLPAGGGLGAHSGAVYANYIYLLGGLSSGGNGTDLTYVRYARFNDSNNVVAVSGSNWVEGSNEMITGRRRGSGFGYNGYLYILGGYDGSDAIADIEFAKIDVSDGSWGTFSQSTVTIQKRWGLTAPVSNSYAYVIGGCIDGAAPGGCNTRTNTIQTFQVYNNESGSVANYDESTGDLSSVNDRIGSSATVLDGYIYVAGGKNGASVTNSVQVAQLNPNGTIGAWKAVGNLPAGRAYGQLETVGGSLYYIGGEDAAGDEKSEIYYAVPTGGVATNDVIRTTTYKLSSAEFSGFNYTLTLDDNLSNNYFAIVAGGDDTNNTSGPNVSQARVDGDPFGGLSTTTSANEIRLERGATSNSWDGTVTIVECISQCSTDGFQLAEVLDTSLASGNLSTDVTLVSAHSARTVPFGGGFGGGLSTAESNQNNFSATAGVRVRKNSTNQIRIERNDSQGTAAAADITTYVVTWGSNWTVQESNFDNWNAGGTGVDDAGEYTTQSITSVARANTWLWKSPGTSEQNGIGDGSFGKVLTLGDGTTTELTSESTVALGSRHSAAPDVRDDTVYVMEHSTLAVDYRKYAQADQTSFLQTVDATIVSQSVTTSGNVTTSDGYAFPLFYASSNGTGTAYSRAGGWSFYHSNDTTVSIARGYGGQDAAGWIQSVDFGNGAGDSGEIDITSWSTASGGIGDTLAQAAQDRTRHGAAVWNDRIYVVGGLNDSAVSTNTVYISPKLSSGGNIAADSWREDTDVPDTPRRGATLIAYANNLYYVGGNNGTSYFSDVQYASIGYKTGTIAQSGNTVTGTGTTWSAQQLGDVIQYKDGSTAVITAFNSTTSLTVDVSKTVTAGSRYLIDDGSVGNWTFTTSLPRYVSNAEGFAANGFLYIVGGRSAVSTCTNNTYVTSISANTTIETGNNPTGISEWSKTNVEFAGDRYGAAVAYNEGKIYVSGGGCGSELTSNQHYYGTLKAQPQIARYSYYIDADSNVFPNAWLLNGLDNNIGARWQFNYRSSTNATNAWGVDTNFGDVTLGNVEDYIPYDATGTDTNFARYFYLTVSVDASQTYGYPDDVSRGPTVDDMTIFFVSDPNKRLRHGKTFIQGIEQPLDTPPPGY